MSRELDALLTFVNSHNFALIVGIDSNSHSLLYGNETNRRGEIFEEFILNNQLTVENVGRTPTFQSAMGQSIIDVTLTKNLGGTVKEWWVDQSFNGSDHNTISFKLGKELRIMEATRPWAKADCQQKGSSGRPAEGPEEMHGRTSCIRRLMRKA